jgi:3-oxoacyl-[acyl-carrier protein] reductase
MELGLSGRTALITGGSKGIGKSIARGLAAEGANVVLLARGQELLDKTAGEIKAESSVEVLTVTADIREADSVKAATETIVAKFPTINILVNNAGGPIKRMDRQIEWPDTDWMDDINLKMIGMLRVTQAILPHMAKDGSGRIINISGIAGISVLGPALTHGFNNSAMNHVTTYLAQDLAAEQITVNAVVPGLIGTEWREAWAENMGSGQGKTKEEFLDEYCKRLGIVSGRWGSPDEVADLTVFLASDRARYINGARIMIDGGYDINVRS